MKDKIHLTSKLISSAEKSNGQQTNDKNMIKVLAGNTANLSDNNPQKQWKSPFHNSFIEFWQAIFNRRVASCGPFALQVGDIFIFIIPLIFIVFCYTHIKREKPSGKAADCIIGMTLIFGCRNGLLSYIFGISLERALLWHQYLAWISLAAGINHWMNSVRDISGYFLIGVISSFVVFSLKPIRRCLWELFMKLHWILIILFIVACAIHGASIGVFGFICFSLDVCFRIYQARKLKNLKRTVFAERIGKDIVKISFEKDEITYRGGQYFFIMIPKLSYFQWHPFSVATCDAADNNVEFYIKSLGDWTKQLFSLAGKHGKPVVLFAYFDGPYGTHSITVDSNKYQNFLCLSGGIGVTPVLSLTKELICEIKEGRQISHIQFIWTGREQQIIEKIIKPDELYDMMLDQDPKQGILDVKCYLSSGKVQHELVDLEHSKINHVKNDGIFKIKSGRPSLEKYFERAHKKALKSKNTHLVGVIVCGPQSLINSAETLAQRYSRQGVRFDVHQEVFLF